MGSREKDKHTWEVIEALEIYRVDENCISMLSVALSEKKTVTVSQDW